MPAPPPDREVPDGYELVVAEDPAWRLVTGKRCRWGGGYHKKACGKPSAAEFGRTQYRRTGRSVAWWAYCEQHLYGRWIEDGKIMIWILREKSGG